MAEDAEDFGVETFESGVEFGGGTAVFGGKGWEFEKEGVREEAGVAVEAVGV